MMDWYQYRKSVNKKKLLERQILLKILKLFPMAETKVVIGNNLFSIDQKHKTKFVERPEGRIEKRL